MKSGLFKIILIILVSVLFVTFLSNLGSLDLFDKKSFSNDNGTSEETVIFPEETEPLCNGIHSSWKIAIEGHYRDACKYCGEGAVETTAHELITDDSLLTCEVCRYVPKCGGVHEYVSDETGHYKAACEHCGTAETSSATHIFPISGECVCVACGYIPVCNGFHEYLSDENGHYKEECQYCGAAAVGSVAHTFEEIFTEQDGGIIHSFECNTCDYVYSSRVVPSKINAYFAPSALDIGTAWRADTSVLYDYYRMDCNDVGSQHIWLRESYMHPNIAGTLGGGGSMMSNNINVGQARYLVVRMRSNEIPSSFYFCLSTTGFNYDDEEVIGVGSNSVSSRAVIPVSSEFSTYVLDLSLLGKFYAANESGDYVLDTFFIGLNAGSADCYLDINYIAFADTYNEVAELVEDESVIKVTDLKGNFEIVNPDGSCSHIETEPGYLYVDNEYHCSVVTCLSCGEEISRGDNEPHVDEELNSSCDFCERAYN